MKFFALPISKFMIKDKPVYIVGAKVLSPVFRDSAYRPLITGNKAIKTAGYQRLYEIFNYFY